ncbi:hypothetical protein RND81_04G104800 [Saponaria officinalis]|uniref:Protein kinase domain-containing protein n=1 Tax=Saponaria officinalis TaxID=3572 RepID=A0AAW1LMV2_SAPOF
MAADADDDNKSPTPTAPTTLLILTILLLTITTTADDSVIMSDLFRSLNPSPPGWSGPNPCKWQGVSCDNSNRVTSINLAGKFISGTLPPNLRQLSALQTLSLQRNRLTGKIPSLSSMPELRVVFLDDNVFSGIQFPFLDNLPSLQFFSVDDNPLENWSIPPSLSNSSSLQQFHASNSSLNGSIPDIFGSLTSLNSLRLSYNDLTGSLPNSFGGTFVKNLWINNQKTGLSGGLFVLESMTNLAQVWVQDNSFSGQIPDLSKCVNLFDLQLRDNQLTGIIPNSITNLPNLLNISLQNNKFQGPMPIFPTKVRVTLGNTNSFCMPTPGNCDPQVNVLLEIVGAFGYPSLIADSWKGNDACNNWVHVTCDAMKKVSGLNFGKLGWVGSISPAFANLTSLTSIYLNDNDLVGTIPEALTMLKMLRKLDLSNNNLTGKVPNFDKSVVVFVNGNPFLGTNVDTSSSVKSPPGVINSPLGTVSTDSKGDSHHLSPIVMVGIGIVCLLLLTALGFYVFRVFMKKKKAGKFGGIESIKTGRSSKGKSNNKIEDLKMSSTEFPLGSPTEASSMLSNIHTFFDHGLLIPIEVLRDVTGHFSDKNILGRGGFGVVYKGVLQDGTHVAVKRMESNLQGTKGMSEFQAEIAVLSKVRHRNLVALLGYCVTKEEKIVVYEYMPKGTLGQHLYECDQKGFLRLTWKERLVIALDVARGVEYLHSLAQQSFIHRDLKPSNILLGDNMRAKVSDFGLVKSAPDQGKYSVETRLAGTFGYLAPEYAATGRVTTKVDVFAFGVVLMELITGRKALDESFPEDQAQLVNWFRRVLLTKENIGKALDPYLEGTDDEEIFASICKVAELSGHCTVREPQQRPDMSHAVNILSPLVNQWRPAEIDGDEGPEIETDISLPEALKRWQAGETTVMSDYSMNDSRNYQSDTTTPAMNESFTSIQGR